MGPRAPFEHHTVAQPLSGGPSTMDAYKPDCPPLPALITIAAWEEASTLRQTALTDDNNLDSFLEEMYAWQDDHGSSQRDKAIPARRDVIFFEASSADRAHLLGFDHLQTSQNYIESSQETVRSASFEGDTMWHDLQLDVVSINCSPTPTCGAHAETATDAVVDADAPTETAPRKRRKKDSAKEQAADGDTVPRKIKKQRVDQVANLASLTAAASAFYASFLDIKVANGNRPDYYLDGLLLKHAQDHRGPHLFCVQCASETGKCSEATGKVTVRGGRQYKLLCNDHKPACDVHGAAQCPKDTQGCTTFDAEREWESKYWGPSSDAPNDVKAKYERDPYFWRTRSRIGHTDTRIYQLPGGFRSLYFCERKHSRAGARGDEPNAVNGPYSRLDLYLLGDHVKDILNALSGRNGRGRNGKAPKPATI